MATPQSDRNDPVRLTRGCFRAAGCIAIAGLCCGLACPLFVKVRDGEAYGYSASNLRQIGVALSDYHRVNGRLPAPAMRSTDGMPLLSWRVELLPYLEQDNIYRQFRL